MRLDQASGQIPVPLLRDAAVPYTVEYINARLRRESDGDPFTDEDYKVAEKEAPNIIGFGAGHVLQDQTVDAAQVKRTLKHVGDFLVTHGLTFRVMAGERVTLHHAAWKRKLKAIKYLLIPFLQAGSSARKPIQTYMVRAGIYPRLFDDAVKQADNIRGNMEEGAYVMKLNDILINILRELPGLSNEQQDEVYGTLWRRQ